MNGVSSDSLNSLFAEASRRQGAGALAEAEALYLEILKRDPRHGDALNQLGVISYRRGRHNRAIELICSAIILFPAASALYYNAGLAAQASARPEKAIGLYSRAEALRPGNADALCNLGNIHHSLSQPDKAEAFHRAALNAAPGSARVHYNLALTLKARGDRAGAERHYRIALILLPNYADALANLGNELLRHGDLGAATSIFLRMTRFDRPAAETQFNLGNLYRAQKHPAAAIDRYRASLVIDPGITEAGMALAFVLKGVARSAEAFLISMRMVTLKPFEDYTHIGLADVLTDLGAITDATNFYRKAVILNPTHADALNNLANVQKSQGFLDEAVVNLNRALAAVPDMALAHSNLLFTQLYQPQTNLSDIHAAALGWNAAQGRSDPRPRPSVSYGDRPPRIGFLSADFRTHVVANLIIPAIETLHRRGLSLMLYSANPGRDAVTERFIRSSSELRDVADLSDENLADVIREDGIDILIDLGGHTAGNRMPAMARRLAPIQATWVGYPATTGISAMDYFLADHGQVPDDSRDYFSEKIIRFPHSYICYEPVAGTPDSTSSPFLRNGFVTFGSFNENVKITPGVLVAWARILNEVPHSRLLFKSVRFDDPGSRRIYADRLTRAGVDLDRVDFVGRTDAIGHVAAMAQADIALDSFPYTGGATTLESLWMGVPVVTIRGETMAGRHAQGYLACLGMTDYAAGSVEEYVEIASQLALDRPRLTALREGLRLRMTMSPLCDRHRFAEAFEAAIDEMWRRHCAGEPAASFDISAA